MTDMKQMEDNDDKKALTLHEEDRGVAALAPSTIKGAITTTFDLSTNAGKMKAFAATQNAEPIEKHLGEKIALANVVLQPVSVTSSLTGEIVDATRVILVGNDGKAYTTVSDTVLRDLNTLFSIFGMPSTWADPINIEVQRIKGNAGHFFYKIQAAI